MKPQENYRELYKLDLARGVDPLAQASKPMAGVVPQGLVAVFNSRLDKRAGSNTKSQYRANGEPLEPPVKVINNTKYLNEAGELELPQELLDLIDNKMYLPRHLKLAREYGVDMLLTLAGIAKGKGKPNRYYAKSTSVAKWLEVTLPIIKKIKANLKAIRDQFSSNGIKLNEAYMFWIYSTREIITPKTFNILISNIAKDKSINEKEKYLMKSLKEKALGIAKQDVAQFMDWRRTTNASIA